MICFEASKTKESARKRKGDKCDLCWSRACALQQDWKEEKPEPCACLCNMRKNTFTQRKKKIAVNLRKCQKLTGAAQTPTRPGGGCSSVAPANGNEAVQFGFTRAQGTGCNWWAPSCHLSTFLKWSQGTCAPICADSLCKIKPRWKPVWGHKMPAIISQFCSSTSAAKSPGFGGAGIFVLIVLYFLDTALLQQDFLQLCSALTSSFTIKTKQNVSGSTKLVPQGPVLLFYARSDNAKLRAQDRCVQMCWARSSGLALPEALLPLVKISSFLWIISSGNQSHLPQAGWGMNFYENHGVE